MTTLWAAPKTLPIGDFPTFRLFGLTFDTNVIVSTLVVAVLIVTLTVIMGRKATSGVPSKFQLLWEILTVNVVGDLAESAIGKQGKRFVPLGVTLFLIILFSNWLGFLPTTLRPGQSYDILPPPTSDVNLPIAMAIFVVIWVHVESIKARRLGGYLRHYKEPFVALLPINIIEEITKPITLTFRLFGNIFAGALMISVITVITPIYAVPLGEGLWKPFDLFIGLLQAYIFMLLAVLYFGMAMSHDESHDHAPAHVAPALTTS